MKKLSDGILAAGPSCDQELLAALDRIRIGPGDYARVRTLLQRAAVPLPPYSGWFDPPKLKPGQLPPYRRIDPLQSLMGRLHHAGPLERRVVSTLAIIEALGRQRSVAVASRLVAFTFRLSGFAFRVQVSRALESLGPWAVPGLLALASRKPVDFKVDRFGYLTRKYAQYMLGVIEEGDPRVALARADRQLKAALLDAYGKHRVADAVPAVIARTDDDDPLIRGAARRALESYFEGPRPRSLRRRLKLPGGRETEQRRLLYMNYRQRAVYELRRELERLTGGDYDRTRRGRSLVAMLYRAQQRHAREVRRESYDQLVRSVAELPPGEAFEKLDRFLAREPRPEQWDGFVDVLFDLAVRSAGAGLIGQARRLVLMAGLIRGGRWLDEALADNAYLHGLEDQAEGHRQRALDWYQAALIRDAGHPGARRGIESLRGGFPSWVQLFAFFLLVVVSVLFGVFVVSHLRVGKLVVNAGSSQTSGTEVR